MLEPYQLKVQPCLYKIRGRKFTSFGNEVGGINIPKGDNEDSLWYTYCKKLRHTQDKCWKLTQDKCWKLHGKPPNPNWNWTLKRK